MASPEQVQMLEGLLAKAGHSTETQRLDALYDMGYDVDRLEQLSQPEVQAVIRILQNEHRPVVHPGCVRCLRCGNVSVPKLSRCSATGAACIECRRVYERSQVLEMETLEASK